MPPDGREARLFVDRLARRPALVDAHWARSEVRPIPFARVETLKKLRPVRSIDGVAKRLSVVEKEIVLDIGPDDYWPRFEEVVFEHLLLTERRHDRPRADFLTEALGDGAAELGRIRTLAKTNLIQAILEYRQLIPSGLAEAKRAVEALRDGPGEDT
jgi:hypothetical protein